MAITRAQQAKQMLREGGRLGYRFGGGYQGSDASTGKGGASKGSSKSSDRNTGGGGSPFSGNGASARNPHFHECLLVTIMMVRWC